MSEEQEKNIHKDLLWDYMEAEKRLETFRVEFRKMADEHEAIARLLRERPETVKPDFEYIRAEAETLAKYASEYHELLGKNADRRGSLLKLGILPQGKI